MFPASRYRYDREIHGILLGLFVAYCTEEDVSKLHLLDIRMNVRAWQGLAWSRSLSRSFDVPYSKLECMYTVHEPL